MISIVVCSINDQHFKRFFKSVCDTIGVDFEIIKIENSIERISIAQAYNRGAKSAIFEILVFVHEDIVFHTFNWGKCLINHFNSLVDPGVLGLAGTSYLPLSPSDWWVPDSGFRHFHYMQNQIGGNIGSGKIRRSDSLEIQKVFVLDGVFLCLKKKIYNQFLFDENLEGFHGYDTSLCLRIGIVHTNYFISDILIEHFSSGHPNTIWLVNTLKAFKSIERISLENYDSDLINKKVEEKNFRLFLSHLKKYGPNYSYQFKEALYFTNKILNHFFSIKILLLSLSFQLIFLLQALKKKN